MRLGDEPDAPTGGRPTRRARGLAVGASAAAHLLALSLLFAPRAATLPAPERVPVEVTLVAPPHPPAPPSPVAAASVPAAPEPARASRAHAVRSPPPDAEIAAADSPSPQPGVALTDGELASATNADAAPLGGACDMARALQRELRRDPRVRAAVREAGGAGGAFKVWNGEWVAHPGQDGRGLAALREAILWQVGFAPKACRDAPVRGLILLAVDDAPDGPRVALGAPAWRWSDLLGASALR